MIFLFFMITDPKTVPSGRVGRVVFGVLVAVTSALLMAPQTDEWGTKVGLLAGLVVICAARPLVDRFVPEPVGGRPASGLRPGCVSGGTDRRCASARLAASPSLVVGGWHRGRRGAGARRRGREYGELLTECRRPSIRPRCRR